jgi:hypothetical protein
MVSLLYLFLLAQPLHASESTIEAKCKVTRHHANGSVTEERHSGRKFQIPGENESERIFFTAHETGDVSLTAQDLLDGELYESHSVTCNKNLSCDGNKKKRREGKVYTQPLRVENGSTISRIFQSDRVLFAVSTQDQGYNLTFINYPLPKAGFVGVELSCKGLY